VRVAEDRRKNWRVEKVTAVQTGVGEPADWKVMQGCESLASHKT
jgi:hypothetical protein